MRPLALAWSLWLLWRADRKRAWAIRIASVATAKVDRLREDADELECRGMQGWRERQVKP